MEAGFEVKTKKAGTDTARVGFITAIITIQGMVYS
jgi:hypothetical protein